MTQMRQKRSTEPDNVSGASGFGFSVTKLPVTNRLPPRWILAAI